MFVIRLALLLAALLLVRALPLHAQVAVDPSGHWEGAVQIPNNEMKIEIDLAVNARGERAGTFSQPSQGVKGLPLSTVAIDGRTLRFVVKAGAEASTFAGTVSADGTSIAGDVTLGGHTIPFSLTRTGEARIAAAPKNSAIDKALEGTWNGTLDLGERQMRLILTMANRPDGTATGTIVSPDGSGVEIPVAMALAGNNFTFKADSVGASFAGVVNPAKTEMTGTWTQGPTSLPLRLQLAKP